MLPERLGEQVACASTKTKRVRHGLREEEEKRKLALRNLFFFLGKKWFAGEKILSDVSRKKKSRKKAKIFINKNELFYFTLIHRSPEYVEIVQIPKVSKYETLKLFVPHTILQQSATFLFRRSFASIVVGTDNSCQSFIEDVLQPLSCQSRAFKILDSLDLLGHFNAFLS